MTVTLSPEKRERVKVFISYSRADTAFADELVVGLDYDGGFDVSIDRTAIHEGEAWQDRLASLIGSADTIIFILTPGFVESKICQWELAEAQRLSKRLVPVLVQEIDIGALPPSIARINFVRFDAGYSFMKGLTALRRTLNTDLGWLREHTRLFERASEWDHAGRLANRMLSGEEISRAKEWLARQPSGAPAPTELHRDFIHASEIAEVERAGAERRRLAEIAEAQAAEAKALLERHAAIALASRRTTIGMFVAGGLATAAGGLAYWGINAEGRFNREVEERKRLARLGEEEARRRGANRTDIRGQVVAFAASPGQLALDGPPGSNSPYTTVALNILSNPNTSLQSALLAANAEVLARTDNQQRPFFSADMNGEIYLQRQPDTRKRNAIVISADRLANAFALNNVHRDAEVWDAFLVKCGFEVKHLRNPTRSDFMREFRSPAFPRRQKDGRGPSLIRQVGFKPFEPNDELGGPKDTLLLLYFSGMGLYLEGRNYLAAIDTNIDSADVATATSIDLSEVLAKMREGAAASVAILDTGFWNPTEKSR